MIIVKIIIIIRLLLYHWASTVPIELSVARTSHYTTSYARAHTHFPVLDRRYINLVLNLHVKQIELN